MNKQSVWLLALVLGGCQMAPQQQDPIPEPSEPSTGSTDSVVVEPKAVEDKVAPLPEPKVEPVVLTPQQQDNVWDRISMQLELDIPDHKTVDYYRRWYLKHPLHLRTVSKRAEPFLHLIVEKIEARELPLELALLPVVESSFDAFAYSHGSAAGLWQFVPATGKMYGLEQDYWYDGRRDVDAATDAALDYLTYLNKRFEGNWNHAIAAYNSGGGRVSSAIRKNVNAGKPTDFFSLELPKETSGYVPKLLALADVIANAEEYGIDIPEIANAPVLQRVDPKEQLDLAIAANYAGISIKELQSYNPAYNQWATAPDGPQHLLLPIETVTPFLNEVEANRGKGVKLVRYQVKSGDSISVIAQRHNTTSAVIRNANGMTGNMIRAGQYLLVPTSTTDDKSYALSAANRLEETQSKARGQHKMNYTVVSGDSLWTIAKAHKVTHQDLARWNGMGPRDTLRIGQKLVIWKDNKQGEIIRTVYYKVRSGDTISGIASRFKVRSSDIIQWNSLQNRKYLQPGQNLKLYVDVTKVSV
jgi:membrane-bound lytic murein transglycosylase D